MIGNGRIGQRPTCGKTRVFYCMASVWQTYGKRMAKCRAKSEGKLR